MIRSKPCMPGPAHKAFELVHILLDEGLLKTRHLGPDAADRTRLLAIVGANVDYLQAAVAAFSP